MATYALTIGGAAKEFLRASIRISETANGRNTLSVEVPSSDGSYRPAVGEEVILTEDGTRIFGGYVDTPSETGLEGRGLGYIVTRVTAVDFNALADRRYVSGTVAGGTLKTQLQSLVTNYLATYGVSLDAAQVDGPAMGDLPADYTQLTEVLNQMASLSGHVWEIDYSKVMRMVAPASTAAPFNLADDDGNALGDVTVAPTRSDYANRIILRFSAAAHAAYAYLNATGNFSDGETVTLGGQTYTFKSPFVDAANNIAVGASLDDSLVNLAAGITAGAGEGVGYGTGTTANASATAYWLRSGMMVARALTAGAAGNSTACTDTCANANWITEGGGVVATLGFGADEALSNVVQSNDAAEQAAEGLWERVVSQPTVFDYSLAQSLADAYLAAAVLEPKRVQYLTKQSGVHPGQTQTIALTDRGLSGTFVVTDVEVAGVSSDGGLLRRVTATGGTSIPTRWQDYARQLFSGTGGGGGGATSLTVISGGSVGGSGTAGKLAKWTSSTSAIIGDSLVSESGSTVTVTGSLVVTAGVTAGSGAVGIIDATGKVPALSSTYFASLSAANLTGLPAGQLTGTITSATQDLITRTGTVVSGTWSASFGAVSGANLTNLTAGNLTGTIPSAVLGNSSLYIGTTAVALNRASGALSVAGLSVTGAGTWNAGAVTSSGGISGTTGAFSGLLSANGGIAVDTDKFTVADGTGNTVVGGTLGVTGAATFSSTITSSLIPTTTDAYDLGRHDKLWDEAFISVINAVVFQQTTQTIFGGYSTIAPQAGAFAADVASAATSIDFGQAMTPDDWVLVRAHDTGGTVKTEYLQVGTLVSGTTYNVTRDLAAAHGTDPAWASGTPFLVLGADGDGRIDMLAYDGSPRIVFTEQGATYNAQDDRAVIGNLNGYYGYAAPTFGFAAGDAAAANITVDATNGLRIRHGVTDKIALTAAGDASFSGAVTSTSGTIGGWTLGAATLTGGNATLASSGNLTLGTGDDVLRASADDATYRLWVGDATAADAPFRVTKAGAATLSSVTITAGNVTLDSTGLYISPVSASGGGAYANANAVRWTTDTTYRTAIWRSDDSSASAVKAWYFDAFYDDADTVLARTRHRTKCDPNPGGGYAAAYMSHWCNGPSGSAYAALTAEHEYDPVNGYKTAAGMVAWCYQNTRRVVIGHTSLTDTAGFTDSAVTGLGFTLQTGFEIYSGTIYTYGYQRWPHSTGTSFGATGKPTDGQMGMHQNVYYSGGWYLGDTGSSGVVARAMDSSQGASNDGFDWLHCTSGTNPRTATVLMQLGPDAYGLRYRISGVMSWNTKSVNTTYQASCDGFVVAYSDGTGGGVGGYFGVKTDGSNPPATWRSLVSLVNLGYSSLCTPVKKGDYYNLTTNVTGGSPTFTVWWVPMGTAG